MESTVSQKLDALQKLQSIDTQLDEIKAIRGALPEEVKDLEDEIEGYQTRINKIQGKIEELESNIVANKNGIKDAEKLIQKYTDQQMNVRNNREYDAITKEIELQNLEIQIFEKRTKETLVQIEEDKKKIEDTESILTDRNKDLDSKKQDLETILTESEDDEAKLLRSRERAYKQVESRLQAAYSRLRDNARNGLAVVQVERNACGGCFNVVPPQRQADVRERKKIIVCEHCGRILSNVVEVIEEEPVKKPRRTTRKKKAE
ncbi:MAG: C4-type zinc ribbon domain-containing protein [Cytophagales bacterium]|nr:C4-type zinc ribbon domain-containing protein [Cytophagales bacterium]